MDKATIAYEKAHQKAIEHHWKENVMNDRTVRLITPVRVAVTFVVTLLITFYFNGL
jgi:type VI protein secretion system component VasF